MDLLLIILCLLTKGIFGQQQGSQGPFVIPGQEGTVPLFNQQPGGTQPGLRNIRYQDLKSIDWRNVDRRDEERK